MNEAVSLLLHLSRTVLPLPTAPQQPCAFSLPSVFYRHMVSPFLLLEIPSALNQTHFVISKSLSDGSDLQNSCIVEYLLVPWLLPPGFCLLASASWLLPPGFCLLASASWLLLYGFCLGHPSTLVWTTTARNTQHTRTLIDDFTKEKRKGKKEKKRGKGRSCSKFPSSVSYRRQNRTPKSPL